MLRRIDFFQEPRAKHSLVTRIKKDVCRIWREKDIYYSYCSYICSNRLSVRILLKVLYGRPEIPRYHRTRTLNVRTTNNIMTMDNNNHLHLTRAVRPCLSDLVSYCPIGTVLGSNCSPSPCHIDYQYINPYVTITPSQTSLWMYED